MIQFFAMAAHLIALMLGLLMLHKFGELFQTGHAPNMNFDIVEMTYLTVCGSTLLCPVAIYDLLLTALNKSAINVATLAYMAGSGVIFAAFHLISYKTMKQVQHDGCRWRVF